MSFLDDIGEGLSDAWNWAEGAVGDAGEWLFGDGGRAERKRADKELRRLREHMPYAYELTPNLILAPESEAAEAYADPRYVEAMNRALGQLEQWGRGEMTEADLARRDLARRQLAQDERGSREAVTRSMQERGLGGGGLEAMGLLGAQQGMADRLSAQDAALQVAVQDRALRAIEGAGQLGSRGREQSYGEERDRRSAIDRFNLYNTEARREHERDRVGARREEYQNQEDMSALALGQYNRNADADRERRDSQRGAIGDVIDWFAG